MTLKRRAQVADLAAILAIETVAQSHPWSLALFNSCFADDYHFWVLEEDNAVQAFLVVLETQFDATVMNIAVKPSHQRRGYARALLQAEIQRLRATPCEQLLLEVRASNQPAIAAYQCLGFTQIGRRKAYYPAQLQREDALVYALKFQ